MFDACQAQGCNMAVMLGDNIYEKGIKVDSRDDERASFREIVAQFDEKFAKPYEPFGALTGFHLWAVLGNHDYRRNASGTMVRYSEFSVSMASSRAALRDPQASGLDSDARHAHGYGCAS